jgi:quinol monooxygenase YgiN
MIMRMILVNVPVEKAAEAQRLWKNECAPLMIKQSGCISEQLLRGRDNDSEFISVSTWEDQASIDRYRASNAYKTIQQRAQALMDVSKIEVKTYDIVQW